MADHLKILDLSNTASVYHAAATAIAPGTTTVHISGQYGATKSGHVPADYESQILLALLNLRKCMAVAGATVNDIAKLTVYIVGYNSAQRKHTRPIQRFLRGHRPAMTLVPVTQLANPAWLFEIEAVIAMSLKPQRSLSTRVSRESCDVLVVGAGLAGLTAATHLVRKGFSCVVLEARDRVGGKTWSQPLADGGIVELGAAWINDTNQSHMAALARQFGLELIEQNTDGDVAFQEEDGNVSSFAYGSIPKFDKAISDDIARIRDTVEADCQKLSAWSPQDADLDAITFEAYLGSKNPSKQALLTATTWTRAMLGVEPRDVSALFFLNYCKSGGGLLNMRSDRKGGAQALRVRKGTMSFSTSLEASLPRNTVRLSSPVEQVVQDGDSHLIQVKTTTGLNLQARKLITTVPSPALKQIQFWPGLPAAKCVATQSADYGYYTKVMMVFRSAFWVDKGFCGLAQSFTGPAAVIRDTSSPADSKHVLTCFMGGMPGQEWSELPLPERRSLLLAQIDRLFQAEGIAKRDFVEMHVSDWVDDPWAGYGCPCASMPPGVLDTLGSDILRSPYRNIHFAGTETAGEWKGYMEGAVRSGEIVAEEVVKELHSPMLARL